MPDERQENLLKLLENGEGIQYILNTAAEFLGNPINMYDVSYKMLAHTENRVSDDPLWNELIKLGTFSHQTVDFFKTEKFIEAYAAAPVALMASPKLKYDRANAVIFNDEGIQIANICIIACYKPFAGDDFKLLEIVTERLAKEMQKNDYFQKIPHAFEDKVFSYLIEGRHPDDPLCEKEIKELSCSLKDNIYIAVVDIIQYENMLTHLAYFKDLFKSLKNECHYFIYLNNIVILFSADRPVLNAENELKELNAFFSQYRIYAGVSSSFHSLTDIKTHFREAINALNYGISLDSGKNIFSYDIFSIELFVNFHAEETDIVKLCHPIFFSICEYDKKNKTEYLEILYSFFITGLEPDCAARRMKMSGEKFSAFLKNAADIFAIDWNDGNMLFAIFRSIKFYKCFSDKFL